jgi:hypothetical protein
VLAGQLQVAAAAAGATHHVAQRAAAFPVHFANLGSIL